MPAPMYNVLFPVETINRELDFRLFLAAMFVNSNRRIYIGNMQRINRMIRNMYGGLYVGKHIFYRHPNVLRYYKCLKEKGFAYVYLQEEGAIFPGGEAQWRAELDRQAATDFVWLQPSDWLCHWGDFQNEYYRQRWPMLAARMRATGHPRFDIYKPRFREYYAYEAQQLRDRYGCFLLINTNQSRGNNSRGIAGAFHPMLGYLSSDTAKHMRTVRLWAKSMNIIAGIVALVHRLHIEFPELPIVLRPHPSESIDFYRQAFRNIDNVHVVYEGPVGPWIIAAEALLHDGCTTAIEAHFADKPVISFRATDDPEFDQVVPNEIGARCRSEDDVLLAVDSMVRGRSVGLNASSTVWGRRLLANFSHDAFGPLLETMEEALSTVGPPRQCDGHLIVQAREAYARLRELPREWAAPLSRRKQARIANHQKFYGFKQDVIEHKLNTIQRLLNKPIRYWLLSDQLIVIEAAQ
ncbi:MAG TPA: surface carbohydrate biosynthesis protein [Nevskiales bacterium]|nr:surface carbohydrate biosynthesis protein [Nevskiales bacterium]